VGAESQQLQQVDAGVGKPAAEADFEFAISSADFESPEAPDCAEMTRPGS
jgi:hypothetical protein